MAVIKGLEWTFDTLAPIYEKLRPGYVEKLYQTISAKEYITLLGTYSDHIAIEESIRMEFFSKIEEVIDEHGGKITVYDTIDLQLARKP